MLQNFVQFAQAVRYARLFERAAILADSWRVFTKADCRAQHLFVGRVGFRTADLDRRGRAGATCRRRRAVGLVRSFLGLDQVEKQGFGGITLDLRGETLVIGGADDFLAATFALRIAEHAGADDKTAVAGFVAENNDGLAQSNPLLIDPARAECSKQELRIIHVIAKRIATIPNLQVS